MRKLKPVIRLHRFPAVVGLCTLLMLCTQPAHSAGSPTPRCEIIPLTWAPSLDRIREVVQTPAGEIDTSQRAITQRSEDLSDVLDAQLFLVYVQLFQSLDHRGRSDLFQQQKRWLDQRDQRARNAVVSKGGTLAPVEYSGAFRKLTEDRIADLGNRLQQSRAACSRSTEGDKR